MFNGFCQNYYPVSTDFQQGPCPLATEFFFYLISNMDPIHHCDQIGACGSFLGDNNNGPQQQVALGLDSTLMTPRYSIESRYNDVMCNACVETIQEIKDKVSQPDFEQWALKVVSDFCAWLKPINQDKDCRTFLVDNGMKAMRFIQKMDPKKYCQSIQLCSAFSPAKSQATLPTLADFNNFGIETSVAIDGVIKKSIDFVPNAQPKQQQQQVVRKAVSKPSTPNCQLCKTVIEEMFKFLKDNRTEDSIREALDQVCDWIYSDKDKVGECEGMVNAYTRELVEILVDETDPQIICTLLDQCLYKQNASSPAKAHKQNVKSKARKSQPIAQAPAKEKSGLNFGQFLNMMNPSSKLESMRTCFECKLFIKVIRDNLNNTSTQEELRDWLMNHICRSIPEKSQQEQCNEMVQTYSSAFFKAITQELNPQAACEDLGACHKKHHHLTLIIDNKPATLSQPIETPKATAAPLPVQQKQPFKGDSPVCTQCVDIITKIDEYLSKDSIDQDVSKIIDNVCNKLPNESTRATCTIMVQTMGADIVQQIATMESPRQLCSKMMLCTAA